MLNKNQELWGLKQSYITGLFDDLEDLLDDVDDIEDDENLHENEGDDRVKKVNIFLNSVDKVKQFVNIASKLDCDLDLSSGRYMIDGKSIMGILSLNLSKPIEMNINAKYDMDYILSKLDAFII